MQCFFPAQNEASAATALAYALLQPPLTLAAAQLCRPLVPAAVGQLVAAAAGAGSSSGDEGTGSPPRQQHEEQAALGGAVGAVARSGGTLAAAVALLRVLELCPHVQPAVLRYFEMQPAAPYSLLQLQQLQPGQLQDNGGGPTARDALHASLAGLQACSALRRTWRVAPLLPLLQCPDAAVRWAAVQCIGRWWGLTDASLR